MAACDPVSLPRFFFHDGDFFSATRVVLAAGRRDPISLILHASSYNVLCSEKRACAHLVAHKKHRFMTIQKTFLQVA